eukprot:gene9850-12502_t
MFQRKPAKPVMPRAQHPRITPVGDTDPFRPSRERPVRVRARSMAADTHFEPHQHAWAQLAYSASGMLQVIAARGPDALDEVTYIVPPSRAVWIAPGARHANPAAAGHFQQYQQPEAFKKKKKKFLKD